MNEDIEDKEFESEDFEHALRPKGFEDFRGQDQIVGNLKVFIQAAKERQDALDHVLLHGPPGLGKTTLSNIIATEMGVELKQTSGPVLEKALNASGVFHFDQVAVWKKADAVWFDENVKGANGRVVRDEWVKQAKILAKGGTTEFASKVKKGGVY